MQPIGTHLHGEDWYTDQECPHDDWAGILREINGEIYYNLLHADTLDIPPATD